MRESKWRFEQLITELVSHPCFHSLKAEFEAEGTLFEEISIFGGACIKNNAPFTVKIGGPLARRDAVEAIQLHANAILVPMIESELIALKSLHMIENLLSSLLGTESTVHIFLNIETSKAVENASNILHSMQSIPKGICASGIVIGRSDLSKSMYIDDEESFEIQNICNQIVLMANRYGVSSALGSGITKQSYGNVLSLANHGLSFYETRKCTFRVTNDISTEEFNSGIDLALRLELAWLELKRDLYLWRSDVDALRIDAINQRL